MSEVPSLTLIFNNQNYEIPLQFRKIADISSKICADLFNNKKYQVQSNVSCEVFQAFHQYLISGNLPDIFIDNFNEISQLANEFDIKELKDSINVKKSIWRELENKIEKHEQMIAQLYNVISNFAEKIDQLTIELNRYRTEAHSYLDEEIQKIKNQLEQLSNQHSRSFEDNLEQNNRQFSEKINSINEQIEAINAQFSSQKEINIEQSNEFETLKNQINSCQDMFKLQNEKLNQVEVDINAKLAENDLRLRDLENTFQNQMDEHKSEAKKIQQTFITKDIFNYIFFI